MAPLTYGYQPIPGAYTEMLAPQGGIRPHWQPMLQQLESHGADDIEGRWKRARQTIRDNGVTFNVYSEASSHARPWELDPIPLMLSPDEWDFIRDGLIQRMEVLNRLLADLYGPQTLLEENIIPRELVFANRAFLRPCHGVEPPQGQHLVLHAVDLARAPDGQWRVVKDRTQMPAGTGYALENRIVVSRTFPTLYRDCGVERLAPFFAALRDQFRHLAPPAEGAPLIVILTPGPSSGSYFEHAYLARYLGFPLVQGSDLTVRDNLVYLKTLSGLRRVHAIWRRQADVDCDPLEFRGNEALGVPGLLKAAAAGNVAIANALGSGAAETPALLPFFPQLCRHLLGEEPLMQTLPTRWCGDEPAMEEVLADLDRWVVKRALADTSSPPVFAADLTPAQRERLAEAIRDEPGRYIAQERTLLSAAPCWIDGRLQPRHAMMRAFVVSTRDGWQVLPGGVVRTAASEHSTVVSLKSGGGTKDAWVLARGQVTKFSLLPREGTTALPVRMEENLSSRVADNLYWLGRYIQRAEYQTRLLRTIMRRLTEETEPDGTPELAELLRTLSAISDQLPDGGGIHAPIEDMDRTTRFITAVVAGPPQPGNLCHALGQARRIGYLVRDRISQDTWRILDQLHAGMGSPLHHGELIALLDRLLLPLAAFSGMAFESMTHGFGWRFMDLGFRMERTVMSAQILRELLVRPASYETPVLDAVLEVASSSITYRTRYQSQAAPLPLLELLVADASNPRSILFQLDLVNAHIRELSSLPRLGQLPEQILATELVRFVERHDLRRTLETGADGERTRLAVFLQEIIGKVRELSTIITERYLTHIQHASHFAASVAGPGPAPTEHPR